MKRVWGVVLLVAALCAGVTVVDAAGSKAGSLTMVSASSHQPIDHGGSATTFTVRLPNDASCPGDSAHDQWRVQSFLVPASVEPASLKYALQGPRVVGGFPLFDVATHPVSQVLLRANDGAGAPGFIDALPDMNFAVFKDAPLTPGEYRLGLACTLWRVTDRYWETRIVISAAPSDRPAKLQWRLASAPSAVLAANSSQSWPTVVLVLCGVAVGVAILVRFRRTR